MSESSADGEQTTRPYHSPLRERQTAETRRLILEALAQVIAEQGTSDFTVDDVAGQAGVAIRTVYRHFPSRQALLDGLTDRIDELLAEGRAEAGLPDVTDDTGVGGLADGVASSEELLSTVPAVMRQFDDLEPYSTAMVLTANRGGLRSERHERRTRLFRELLANELEDVDPDEREAVFAVVRHLLSAQTWYVLCKEFGLDGETAGRAVARTINAVLSDRPQR